MKRLSFIKTLGLIAGSGLIIPEAKAEKLQLSNHKSNADLNIGINGVELMRITSSGNVTMGTNTPNARLIVK